MQKYLVLVYYINAPMKGVVTWALNYAEAVAQVAPGNDAIKIEVISC